ncbi:MAG: FGGY-family carbohydrate kinase [Armatimonadota bacterium]
MALMGLDVGSTGCKAVVFDLEGNQLARAYREYPEIYPNPGWIELDPARVMRSVEEVIAEAASASGEPVAALSISAMGETFTPVAKDGTFLYNSIVSPDNRAVAQADAWQETLGPNGVFQITGMPIHPSFTLPKIQWFAQERPEIHRQVWKYLLWPDLIAFKLGLTPRLDYSLAGRTMAFDVVNKQWAPQMLEPAGLPADLFAEPIASGEVVGELTGETASQLGLAEGCLVVAGGHDQPMNALGAGIIKPGLAVDGMGTVECITVAFEKPVLTPEMLAHNYSCYPHVAPGLYCTIAFSYSCGSILRWYRDNFGAAQRAQAEAAGKDVYDIIVSDLPDGPSRLFTIPYFCGSGTPYMDPLAKGAVLGLTLSCNEKTFVKGLLEGTCYELNLNMTSLAQAGVGIDRLRVTGGGSRSPLWLQLKANITGKQIVTLNVSEGGCLAGAMLGGVATGAYVSVAEAADLLVKENETFDPDPKQHAQYVELQALYAKVWPAIREVMHEL